MIMPSRKGTTLEALPSPNQRQKLSKKELRGEDENGMNKKIFH